MSGFFGLFVLGGLCVSVDFFVVFGVGLFWSGFVYVCFVHFGRASLLFPPPCNFVISL